MTDMRVINKLTLPALKALFGGDGVPPAGSLRIQVISASKKRGAQLRVSLCARRDMDEELAVICEGTIDVGACLHLTDLNKIFEVKLVA